MSNVRQNTSNFDPLTNWEENGTALQPVTAGYDLGTSGNEVGDLLMTGSLGIGTATPTAALQVIGDIHAGTGNTGTDCNFVGSGAGTGNSGLRNVAFGQDSLKSACSGGLNSAIGTFAGLSNTTGANNSFCGYAALYANVSGSNNVAFGLNSGRYLSDGSSPNETSGTSVYVGVNTKALADGDANEVVIGYNAIGLGSNTAVLGNSSVATTRLQGSVGIGTDSPTAALQVVGDIHAAAGNTGANSNFIGSLAGTTNSGAGAVGFGYNAGYQNSGDWLVAIGREAAQGNSGSNVTAIGFESLTDNTGASNSAMGFRSGVYQSGGTSSLTTASTSVFLGSTTKGVQGAANQIVIGDTAESTGANSVVLGNSSIATTRLQGNVGIGVAPLSLLHLGTATEELEIVDAGSTSATEQDWITVEVGGNVGYIRVYATK